MYLHQTIQHRLNQRRSLNPQLLHTIRLMHLSTMDLHMEIREQIDSNFMLEDLKDADPHTVGIGGIDRSVPGNNSTNGELATQDENTLSPMREDAHEDTYPSTGWESLPNSVASYSASRGNNNHQEFLEVAGAKRNQTLREYLLWQLNMDRFTATERQISELIIDAINDDGYLTIGLDQIHDELPAGLAMETDEMEEILRRIQGFDPVGVAARSPAECLEIQLQSLDQETPYLAAAREVIHHHLKKLASHDFKGLARCLHLSEDALSVVVDLIRTLKPYPGASISAQRTDYIVPDILVRKEHDQWRVALNPETTPKVRINPVYTRLIKRGDKSTENTCLKNQYQEARWFLDSLRHRSDTMLMVAESIVEHQKAFFERGENGMQPLTQKDLANKLDIHESTVSRITTQKFMRTPRGIFQFKYFFSGSVETSNGALSITALRAWIKGIILNEDPDNPMSDGKITEELAEGGTKMARRTIAKHREAMRIPTFTERRRLGRPVI